MPIFMQTRWRKEHFTWKKHYAGLSFDFADSKIRKTCILMISNQSLTIWRNHLPTSLIDLNITLLFYWKKFRIRSKNDCFIQGLITYEPFLQNFASCAFTFLYHHPSTSWFRLDFQLKFKVLFFAVHWDH